MGTKKAPAKAREMRDVIEQAEASIEDQQAPKKFDIVQFIRNGGTVLPTAQVEVFLDQAAAYEIRDIDTQRVMLQSNPEYAGGITGVPAEIEGPLLERRAELAQRMWDTRIIVHMRGLAPALARAIDKKLLAGKHDDLVEQSVWLTVERLASSVFKVEVPATGDVDTRVLSYNQMKELYDGCPLPEQGKLQRAMEALSFGVLMADRRGDADFPLRSIDLAAEQEDSVGSEDGLDVGEEES